MKIVALALALTLSAFGGAPAWLTSLWSGSSTEEGCGMDPYGCLNNTRPSSDIGCGMDPLGCADGPQPSSDIGAGWDPFG
ncbi:MAG TPA: hypothetical protein VF756_03575 [Thermoanaerobaculia bacterium]